MEANEDQAIEICSGAGLYLSIDLVKVKISHGEREAGARAEAEISPLRLLCTEGVDGVRETSDWSMYARVRISAVRRFG